MRSLPLLIRIFLGWIAVAVIARLLSGGAALRIVESSLAACAWIVAVFFAFTRSHRATGRRLDAGTISNEQYVQQVAANDLWWSLPALAIAIVLALRDSAVWWVTLVAPLSIFAILSLFVARAAR